MRVKMMKRILTAIIIAAMLVSVLAGCGKENNLTGAWKCELYSSEQIIEFTDDGRFIDHTSGAENRYRIKGGSIVVYVEDAPESELEIDYKIKDGKLVFGETEYVKTELPEYMKPAV